MSRAVDFSIGDVGGRGGEVLEMTCSYNTYLYTINIHCNPSHPLSADPTT